MNSRRQADRLTSHGREDAADGEEGPTAAGMALEQRLLEALPELTEKQRRLARLLLDEPYYVAFASVVEIGKRVGIDGATVVRFSRSLGYEGFTDLKRQIQSGVPEFVTAAEKLRQSLSHRPSPVKTGFEVFRQDLANIERTVSLNDERSLEDAVHLLTAARTTLVLAGGISTPVASVLTHLLRLMGLNATQPLSGVAAAAEIAGLDSSDVVVGISFWRYVKATVREFAQAKATGAATIAITDSKSSPLAQSADLALIAATNAVELTLSLVAPISIVNALSTAIALERPEQTLERLAQVDYLYKAAEITIE